MRPEPGWLAQAGERRPRSRHGDASAAGATKAGAAPDPDASAHRRFDGPALSTEFQWPRTPHPERIFKPTGSALYLFGRKAIGNWFEQALVARRQEHFHHSAETRLAFAPRTFQHAARLTTHYNPCEFYFLAVLGDWPESSLS